MTDKLYWILAVLVMVGTAGCTEKMVEELASPWTLCSLVLLILAIIGVVEVSKSNRSVTSKILWILLILFVPLGVIIYFLFSGR